MSNTFDLPILECRHGEIQAALKFPPDVVNFAGYWFSTQTKYRQMRLIKAGGIWAILAEVWLANCHKLDQILDISWTNFIWKQLCWSSSRLLQKVDASTAKDRTIGLDKPIDLDRMVDAELMVERVQLVLRSLTYREREIIKLRYGIGDGFSYTLTECSRIFRVSRERIRQIENKALRKLQHGTRASKLECFL